MRHILRSSPLFLKPADFEAFAELVKDTVRPTPRGKLAFHYTAGRSTPWPALGLLTPSGDNETTVTRGGYDPEVARAYVRVTIRQDQLANALELKDVLVKRLPGVLVHVEVQEAAAEVSVREAARAAVASARDDLSETYADLAKIEEPGTREGVARRLAEYRKAAG
jgi:hypothetical protein